MDFSLKQASGFMIAIVVCAIIVIAFGTTLSQLGQNAEDHTISDDSFFKSTISDNIYGRQAPSITVNDIYLEANQDFNMDMLKTYATATDTVDGDVSSSIKVYGKVDITKEGIYPVKFVAENSVGLKTAYIKNVIVD